MRLPLLSLPTSRKRPGGGSMNSKLETGFSLIGSKAFRHSSS